MARKQHSDAVVAEIVAMSTSALTISKFQPKRAM